jgi:hypothetical protein
MSIYNKLANADFVRSIERGDADTSASTLRTLAAVFLVVIVVGAIVAAVQAAGAAAEAQIKKGTGLWD